MTDPLLMALIGLLGGGFGLELLRRFVLSPERRQDEISQIRAYLQTEINVRRDVEKELRERLAYIEAEKNDCWKHFRALELELFSLQREVLKLKDSGEPV